METTMTETLVITLTDIQPIFERFKEETGIVVTNKAQRQIHELINFVQIDRPETWSNAEVSERYFEQWETVLPDILAQIVEDHHLETKITTIDVVYWTGRNLMAYERWLKICPLPKPHEVTGPMMWKFPWER